MHTTVYLIRNAQTAWNEERRLAGRRELGLSDKGLATAHNLVNLFEGIPLDEVLTSPLPRAVETAKILAAARGLEVARDPRLLDWQAGEWEGRTYEDIMNDPRYAALLGQPPSEITMPGGERLTDVRLRLQSSIEQALSDNELGSNIAIVSHAGPLRLLLSAYLSIPPWDHERLRLEPGSVTVLTFSSLTAPPTLRAMNCTRPLLDTLGSAR
ncbi:MAG: histidine phosphatase family protein [Polyangia bacterium]